MTEKPVETEKVLTYHAKKVRILLIQLQSDPKTSISLKKSKSIVDTNSKLLALYHGDL